MQDEHAGVTAADAQDIPEGTTPPSESTDQAAEASHDSPPEHGEEQTAAADTTDRGTKPAKEPESRYYQTIKNENADMRRLLRDPKALKEYMRDLEGTQAPKDEHTDDFADLSEKVTGPDGQVDVVKLARYMDERAAKKIDEGIKHGVENRIQAERVQTAYNADLATTRSAHPELDPQSDAFDHNLDQLIGERFLAQGGLQGKVSLKTVIDKTYEDIARWKGAGKQEATTQIIRKQAGAIPAQQAQGASSGKDEESSDPDSILAARVRKQFTGRS